MKNLLRKSIKTALVFGIIGAAVATAMPFVMSGLIGMGLLATSSVGSLSTLALASVVHTTGVFGLFGLLVPPVEKLGDVMFGKDEPETELSCAKKSSNKLTINQDIDVGVDARSVNFIAKIEQERTTLPPRHIIY